METKPPLISNEDKGRAIVFVSAFVLVAFVSMTLLLVFRDVPQTNKDMFNIGYGALGTMAMAAVTFWLGSSDGSKKKTEVMQNEMISDNEGFKG